ncbi:MAG: endonuclease III [Ruminococcus sp.]|nr:endonuclease III [Ruminococcus sp.]
MTKKEITALAVAELEKLYPDVECSLEYGKPYELLIATRLAAQCTDARVNIVTKELFVKYPTLEAFAEADLAELEQDVKPCGFYRTKAKSIIEMAQSLISDFGGVVPDTMEELLSLSGVGRKTANLILGDVYGKPAVVTDTHCIRITGRLGLTKNTEPAKVEADLRKLLPPEVSNHFCHQTVQFGRDICRARSPKCGECPLNYFCRDFAKK